MQDAMPESDGKTGPILARQFMGWRLSSLGTAVGILAALVWGAWLTREVMLQREQRIVAVSLKSLLDAYVATTARAGLSEDEAAVRTRAYVEAVERAINSLDDGRTTILVREAVLGATVPDVTPGVQSAVAEAMTKDADHGSR